MLTFIFLFLSHSSWAFQGPSSQSCDYYRELESKLQCGADNYLLRDALPLCEYYKSWSPWMTDEIQAWFPKVRYCLQAKLQEQESSLTCEKMDEVALASHVDCYVQTGYCDLSVASKTQLSLISLQQMIEPLWLKTAEMVLKACYSPN